jgi:hypothetical protein
MCTAALDRLDSKRLQHSLYNFPTQRTIGLNPEPSQDVYDPLFLLPFCLVLVERAGVALLAEFVTSNLLGYVVLGLTSKHSSVRLLAGTVLSKTITILEKNEAIDENIQVCVVWCVRIVISAFCYFC